jgi:hypothetical protein
MTPGAAIVVAVISRLVMTIGDLAWALLAVVPGWSARRARRDHRDASEDTGRLPPPVGHADVAELARTRRLTDTKTHRPG